MPPRERILFSILLSPFHSRARHPLPLWARPKVPPILSEAATHGKQQCKAW